MPNALKAAAIAAAGRANTFSEKPSAISTSRTGYGVPASISTQTTVTSVTPATRIVVIHSSRL
jgi:hypothetical protein